MHEHQTQPASQPVIEPTLVELTVIQVSLAFNIGVHVHVHRVLQFFFSFVFFFLFFGISLVHFAFFTSNEKQIRACCIELYIIEVSTGITSLATPPKTCAVISYRWWQP